MPKSPDHLPVQARRTCKWVQWRVEFDREWRVGHSSLGALTCRRSSSWRTRPRWLFFCTRRQEVLVKTMQVLDNILRIHDVLGCLKVPLDLVRAVGVHHPFVTIGKKSESLYAILATLANISSRVLDSKDKIGI